ncbi:MAG: MBL fold metallo-hydrolase [Candidatus Bathyarchaeota archaeon]|nr:MBL fold metallo-hydrolase [Candidatus Bathyarchaeota archaeon]
MFFKQIKHHGDNFSYIFADEPTQEAAVVDASFNADELQRLLKAHNLRLKYIFCTHGHSDHTAGNNTLRSALGGQIVAHKLFRGITDVRVKGDAVFNVGDVEVKVIYTPGHTPDGICLLVNDEKLLTGDTLFIGECGRTDLPGGDSRLLYDSLFNKLMKLADIVEVYPGHDYGVKSSSTIGEERRTNYVLKPRSEAEFVEFMRQP